MRLTRKFVLTLVLGIMVVLSASAIARVHREIEFFDRDARRDASLVGAVIARAMDHVWRTEGEEAALELLDDVVHRSPHWQIRFVWLEAPASPERMPALPLAELSEVLRGREWSRRIEAGDGLTYTYVPASVPGGRPSAVEIREGLLDERRYIRASWYNTIIATILLIVLCALMASAIGVVFVGRPTRALVNKVRRIGSGDLSGPLPARQKDELGEIAAEVNAMCERLAEAQLRIEKETEERLAAEQQLRHADRLMTVGKLASGMAHELGTPLNVVSGRAQMIANGDSLQDEARGDARIIVEQTKRMTKIMRELLDFARPRPAQRAWVDLRPIAQQTCVLLSALARSHDTDLLVLEGESARANVDASQMQQVFTNLVVNAIHAIAHGGTVKIAFRHVHEKPPADHGGAYGVRLVVEIADTGCGMEPAVASRIFEPFFTTKDVGEGTGLGLSVTHGIVREHGGFITVHSVLHKGTTFAVHLPLESEESGA
jgi:two-component system, NtrC family, sensor kinase